MKKFVSYRARLLELAQIYKILEVRNYVKAKKQLTVPQLELILRKNGVPIPTEIKKSLFEIKAQKIKRPFLIASANLNKKINGIITSIVNIFFNIRKIFINFCYSIKEIFINFCYSIKEKFNNILYFISKSTINILNSFYNFKVQEKKANKLIAYLAVSTFALIALTVTINLVKIKIENSDNETVEMAKEKKIVKILPKKEKELEKKITKIIPKKKTKNNQEIAKIPKVKKKIKPEKKKPSRTTELVLPNLNLKTETVLNLFDDVKYDLKKVRFEKRVQPIYFTQFPKDLDEIQSVKLKKETFIKIVLPLVVAENEKILDDKYKLKKITKKKMTSDKEKSWLRQKLKEYRVRNGDIKELDKRMDIIPISIALAQAAKESGWGTSRFALEGNAIFGQWTWNGKGIAPLSREAGQSHKILRFPILRASVKAYKNNLNTHKGYKKFREKRVKLRKKGNKIKGLDLIHTLDSYAQTGEEYTKILAQIIKQNSLFDFENVKLTNSKSKREFNL